jgi:Ca-activated chloride channel homolog
MHALFTALTVLVLGGIAEGIHARRCRIMTRLAFGTEETPRRWTGVAPLLRVACQAALAWGLVTLLVIPPATVGEMPAGDDLSDQDHTRVLFMLDISPSMNIEDAGPEGTLSRAARIRDVMETIINRIGVAGVKYSVQAFYTDALFVVQDTVDLAVVYNVLDGLPLAFAFEQGDTHLGIAMRKAFDVTREWPEKSTVVFLCTDGDSVDLDDLPPRPRAIDDFVVLGVGNALKGAQIGERRSQQVSQVLRRLAIEMRGRYFDVNRRHYPTDEMKSLSGDFAPMATGVGFGRRKLALLLTSLSALMLTVLPVLLTWFGSGWRVQT